MRVLGFASITQSYKEQKSDQLLQVLLMRLKIAVSRYSGKYMTLKLWNIFLCEEESSIEDMGEAMIMKLNGKINVCATTLNDGKLVAKLSAGDIVPQELKFHPPCLVSLYYR